MPESLRARRLGSLLTLSRRLAGEARGGVVGDALETALGNSGATAGVGFSMGESLDQIAERGLPGGDADTVSRLRRQLRAIAGRCLSGRKTMIVDDPAPQVVADAGVAWKVLIAIPLEHRRTPLGALILAFDDREGADDETVDFFETLASMVAIAVDSERRIEEERSQRAELEERNRIAGIGLVTASVAHELRGPVGALALQMTEQKRLIGELELLATDSDPAVAQVLHDLGELRDDVSVAVRRVRETITQLTTIGRRESDHEELDIASVVKDALWVTRPQLERRGITVIEQLDRGCFTEGKRENLAQVVLNLVINAAEACEQAGRPAKEVTVRVASEGAEVILSVDDTGPGVPAEAVRQIFQPFYTTKQGGRGTGLGLKICSDVVSSHGGHIEVLNNPKGGASFRVVLPRTTSAPAPSEPPRTGRRDTLTRLVLIIDDDEVFARTMRRALKPHDVRIAHTASEGEILLLDPAFRPSLVICDVFLPGVNGDELHRRIAVKRSDLAPRFLFVTGGALNKTEADYIKASGCPTLFKPLDLKDVLAHLGVPDVDSIAPSVRTLTRSSNPAGAPPSQS